jgi:hypothetical protein
MVMTRAGTPTNASGGAGPSSGAARQPKRQRHTRTRLRLDNAADGTDEVEVSSSVAVTTAGAGDPDDDPDDEEDARDVTDDASWNQGDGGPRDTGDDTGRGGHAGGGDEHDEDDNSSEPRRQGIRQPSARRPPRPSIPVEQEEHAQSMQEDSLESMTWWDALTPAQQRATMRRFVVNPPAATTPAAVATPAAATPVVVQARGSKLKKLYIEDFKGLPGESIEAWLSTVRQAVQRQVALGGDTWTLAELYYGVTAHLKGNANKWLVVMGEGMTSEDYMFEYLTAQLRKKYGRHENSWKIHKKLMQRAQQPGERLDSFVNSLTNIGFGKRVSTESYLEAFYDRLNNQDAAAHVCTLRPATLSEALEIAVSASGEYGAGRKVTSWQQAQQRYQKDSEGEEKPSAAPRKSEAKAEVPAAINWDQLGLGFGGGDKASDTTTLAGPYKECQEAYPAETVASPLRRCKP